MTHQPPSPRAVLTSLFSQLTSRACAGRGQISPTNPLRGLAPEDRQLFVTLHCLFPNEFLSALDLLDRQLVTRFTSRPGNNEADHEEPSKARDQTVVHYVRSAQPTTRWRNQSASLGTSYEVRVGAWNCSCPAFIFAAFNSSSLEHPRGTRDDRWRQKGASGGAFGGLSLGEDIPPVCKHLLACFMAEKCNTLFGDFVTEESASKEEMTGWGAGWGDR
ncbi:MAG: hypothetical protein M1837_004633 [Sclerophora amabilis]|nr:MAG: hypothetical protein M1837_004633 [Sclerophora amabilis]